MACAEMGCTGISRQQFGQLVDRIGNFKFAEHAQFFLHEWGKRKMGTFWFGKSPRSLLPLTPLPANIKSFDKIRISHFDASTMAFLGRIGSLLTKGLKIETFRAWPKYLDNLRTILTTLAPMLGGIRAMHCCESTLPWAMECFSREQLAQLKVLKLRYYDSFTLDLALQQQCVNTIMDWLTAPGPGQHNTTNEGPKLFAARLDSDHGFTQQISTAIRQQFHAAKTPSTFATIVVVSHGPAWYRQMPEFHLQNGIGEELHGVWTADEGVFLAGCSWLLYCFQITRLRANCGTELREWVRANASRRNKQFGCISICAAPTIGPFDVAAQQMEEEQSVQQRPCSSKDA